MATKKTPKKTATAKSVNVTVIGYPKGVSKLSSDQIKKLFEDAIQTGRSAWGWTPERPCLSFHRSHKTMGFARSPGMRAKGSMTIISLSHRLIKQFGPKAIKGTLVHELCHHYREETWPRDIRKDPTKGHDDRFCATLRKADPSVNNSHNCRYFTAEREVPDVDPRARWDASLGFVRRIEDRHLGPMLFWVPDKPRTWSPVEVLISDQEIMKLVGRFPSAALPKVRVIGLGSRPMSSMVDLLRYYSSWPHRYPSVAAWIRRYDRKTKGKARAAA